MTIRTVQPGEKGVDFSYSKPPPQLLIDLGITFVAGYSSYNTTGKNCDNPSIYIDAGLTYIDLWEVSQTSTNGGYNVGAQHGLDAAKSAQRKGVPPGVAIVACNDTNTTPANIGAQNAYMDGFVRHETPYQLGMYDDTDLAAFNRDWILGILPSAWSWSQDGEHLPTRAKAEARAHALGYHIFQHNSMYLPGTSYRVDPLECVRPFQAWGNPLPNQPTPGVEMLPVISNAEPHTLPDGSGPFPVGVVKWCLGTVKRHLQEGEWRNVYGSQQGTLLTNADLATIPNYLEGNVVLPQFPTSGKWTADL